MHSHLKLRSEDRTEEIKYGFQVYFFRGFMYFFGLHEISPTIENIDNIIVSDSENS